MFIDRDFEVQPITPEETIKLFKAEMFELALAKSEVIEKASNLAEKRGEFLVANNIISRYDDYQEELRCLAAEFL